MKRKARPFTSEEEDNKEEEEEEQDWEPHLNSIKGKNHLRSLYPLNKKKANQYKELIQLRKKITTLPDLKRQQIYQDNGLELLCRSKSNEISKICWRKCGIYFLSCLHELHTILFDHFVKELQFQNVNKTRMISFYKGFLQRNNDDNLNLNLKNLFEIAIACLKWFNIVLQLHSLPNIKKHLKFVFFDLWFIDLYQGQNLEFVSSESNINNNKKNNKKEEKKKIILSGILKDRAVLHSGSTTTRNSCTSFLNIDINGKLFKLNKYKKSIHFHYFGILYSLNPNTEPVFFNLKVKSIPNTQDVLNEFMRDDIFFQDIITDGIEKQLYIYLPQQFPFDLCRLITEYLRSIFYTQQKKR